MLSHLPRGEPRAIKLSVAIMSIVLLNSDSIDDL